MYANVIMLGALTKITKIVSKQAIQKAVKTSVRANTTKTNLHALQKGLNL